MRKFKKVQKFVTVVDEVICNKCEKSCNVRKPGPYDLDPEPEFGGLIEAEVSGGYFSTIVGDGVKYKFSLCEDCFLELEKTFKIPSCQNPKYRDGDFCSDED